MILEITFSSCYLRLFPSFAVKQHAEITGHEIRPIYANNLETGVKSVDHKKREKTLESIFPMTNKVAYKQSFQLIRKRGSE